MQQITSKDNCLIKDYVKLCADRRYRFSENRFVLEGARLVSDAVKTGASLEAILVTENGKRLLGKAIADWETQFTLALITEPIAEKISQTNHTQGVFAVCRGTLLQDNLPTTFPHGALLLCSLQDPGNIGTILRSAEAFGLSGVLLTADCPDPTAPKVLRASMGASLRLPLYRVPTAVEAIAALRADGNRVFAAALGEESRPVTEISLAGAIVAIGNEGAGLSPAEQAACDGRVILPISPDSESLNAAMAATVFAWELSRGRR